MASWFPPALWSYRPCVLFLRSAGMFFERSSSAGNCGSCPKAEKMLPTDIGKKKTTAKAYENDTATHFISTTLHTEESFRHVGKQFLPRAQQVAIGQKRTPPSVYLIRGDSGAGVYIVDCQANPKARIAETPRALRKPKSHPLAHTAPCKHCDPGTVHLRRSGCDPNRSQGSWKWRN